MRVHAFLCSAALFATFGIAHAATNLVSNPGFENNQGFFSQIAPPWTFSGPAFVYQPIFFPVPIPNPHSGNSTAILITNGTASVSQNIGIPRGGFYNLSFYTAASSGKFAQRAAAAVATQNGPAVQTSINGKVVNTTSVTTDNTYRIVTEKVKLKRGTTSLSLAGITIGVPQFAFLAVDDVTLTFLRAAGLNFKGLSLTQNQQAVADGLTTATKAPSAQRGRLYNALSSVPKSQVPAVLDSLSGEGITAAQNAANRSTELFTSSIFDQTTFYGVGPSANSVTLFDPSPIRELADLPARHVEPTMPVTPNRTWRAWATGFGGVDNIHGNGAIGSAYQQNTIYGGTLGVDYQLMPNYLVGVAVGGTNGDFSVRSRATSGSSTGGHIAIYDLATFGAFYGASSSSFSYFGNRTNRFVSGFGGLGNETERGNFNSNELRTRLEFGRHFAGYGGVLTPFVALELAQLRSNGFTENAVQGAGLFRLNVSGQSQASAPAFVGLRLQRATSIGNGITLSPTLQVAYVHEFAPYRSQIGTLADLPGSTFLVDGARPARNAAQVKAGAEMTIGPRSVIFANFDGEFSGVNQLYAGKGGFRYLW